MNKLRIGIEPARTDGCSRVVVDFVNGTKEITIKGRVFPNDASPVVIGEMVAEAANELTKALKKEFPQ